MTYVLYKYQTGKKIYFSRTGKWIKSASTAAAFNREAAQKKAAELGCCSRPYIFRD